MIRPDSRGRTAAIAVAALGAAALATGIALTTILGGTTGQDLGRDAAGAAFVRATPLLVLAEILKLLVAAAQVVAVRAAAAGAPSNAARRAASFPGIAGALLVAASGLAGFYAIVTRQADLGTPIAMLGFAGLAATGLFALLLLSFEAPHLRRWHAVVTLLFGLISVAALLWAPLALLTAPLSWAFWLGLAARLRPL